MRLKKKFIIFLEFLFFAPAVFSVLFAERMPSPNAPRHLSPEERPWYSRLQNSPPIRLQIPSTPHVILSNGMRVDYVLDTSLPKVHFRLLVEGGAQDESNEEIGLHSTWANLLVFSGSEKFPRDMLADLFETRATSFDSSAGLERADFSLSSFSHFFIEDLQVVLQILQNPRFAGDDLEFLKKQSLRQLEQREENPAAMAHLLAKNFLWQNSRRGDIIRKKDVMRLTRESVFAWHKKMLQTSRLRVVVSGNFELAKLQEVLEKTFASSENNAKEKTPAVDAPAKLQNIFFLGKEIPQSTILFYANGIEHASQDYYALKVFDYLLGGGSFDSHLTQEIRTRRGWAYNVYSSYQSWLTGGSLQIFAQSDAGNTGALILETQKILREPQTFVNETSVKKAKEAIVNRFVFLYSNFMQLLMQKISLQWDGLPPNYLDSFTDNIAKVTVDDVLRVAKKYYAAQNFFIVVVGKEDVRDQLNRAKISAGESGVREIQRVEIPR